MLTNSGIAGSYSYPLPGSPRPHAVTSVGSWSYSYDANGNMTAGAGRTFTYNGDNRPTRIDTQTYSYGPDGERWKTVDSSPGGATTLYLGGSIEIAADVMTKYLPGDAKRVGSPSDPLVETFWLHRDHQGSIQAITDSAGAEVQRFLYEPYGDRIATATAHEESKGWIGERQDATGLFYLHARYYDPVIGRFASADPSDPIAPEVGLNRYAYAFNTPIMRVDPWGLKSSDEIDHGDVHHRGSDRGAGNWKQVRAPSDERGRRGGVIVHGNNYFDLVNSLGQENLDSWTDWVAESGIGGTLYPGDRFGFTQSSVVHVAADFVSIYDPIGEISLELVQLSSGEGIGPGDLGSSLYVSLNKEVAPDLVRDLQSLFNNPSLYLECSFECTKAVAGLRTVAGGGLAAAGQNVIPAPGKLGSTTPGTSPAALAADRLLGNARSPVPLPAPTTRNPFILSRRLSTVAGRAVPIVGYGLLYWDARSVDYCVASCLNPQ